MQRLQQYVKGLGIELSEEQINMFRTYYEMIIETNKVMNLTAITELDEVIVKHFVDSLSLVKIYPEIRLFESGSFFDEDMSLKNAEIDNSVMVSGNNENVSRLKVLDLGTGAGFPGLPLKIALPHLNITLMDSLNKRVKFLQSVIYELKLKDIEAVHGRAEEMACNKYYREQYDLCVSRAVANLSTLSEYCLPFVNINGKFISYKASEINDEVSAAGNAIKTLGGNLTEVKKLVLPESDIERSFVIIDKVKKTPKAYPRKAGTASKNPL